MIISLHNKRWISSHKSNPLLAQPITLEKWMRNEINVNKHHKIYVGLLFHVKTAVKTNWEERIIIQHCDFKKAWKLTLSIDAVLRRIIEACARRSKSILIDDLEYMAWGLNISSMNRRLNIVETMSCMTKTENDKKANYRYRWWTSRIYNSHTLLLTEQ